MNGLRSTEIPSNDSLDFAKEGQMKDDKGQRADKFDCGWLSFIAVIAHSERLNRKSKPMVMRSLLLFLLAAFALSSYAQNPLVLPKKAVYLEQGAPAYTNARSLLEIHHRTNRFCADELLNKDEQIVDTKLRGMVTDVLRTNSTEPFCCIKSNIQKTALFQLLTNMPKGALLHTHLSVVGRMDWILTNVLTRTNCYVIWSGQPNEKGTLKFFSSDEVARQKCANCQPVSSVAKTDPNFVNELRDLLTIDHKDLERGKIWDEFGYIFTRLNGFIRYEGVFSDYLRDAFKSLQKDHIYYVELRDALPALLDLEGKELAPNSGAQRLEALRQRMVDDDSFDCHVILADVRTVGANKIVAGLQKAVSFRKDDTTEQLVIGYDLIASEDAQGGTTQAKVDEVLPELRKAEHARLNHEKLSTDFAYYLHNGESAWADNDNLFDSILLESPRIGHGFNLFRYPTLYPLMRERKIALEVCPISNQLLGLTPDLRIHPAAGYLNAGIQCVLASDDPALFGNDGLSYDFWEAIMAWNLDLAAVKKLARNSILHSGLKERYKNELMQRWEKAWNDFIARQKTALQAKGQ